MTVKVSFYPEAPRGFPMEQEVTLEDSQHYKLLDILKLIIAKSGDNAEANLIEQSQNGAVYLFLGDQLIMDLETAEVSDGSQVSIVIPIGGG